MYCLERVFNMADEKALTEVRVFQTFQGVKKYREMANVELVKMILVILFFVIFNGFVWSIIIFELVPIKLATEFLAEVGIGVISIFLTVRVMFIYFDGFSNRLDYLKGFFKTKRFKNFQKLKPEAMKELNEIVEEENGMLFRKYQYIVADKSTTTIMVLDIPHNAKIHAGKSVSKSEACMFRELDEAGLCDIVTPISEYHRSIELNKKMEQQERYFEEQRKINNKINNEVIQNKPLFKSLSKIRSSIESDVEKYNEEQQGNVSQYSKILKEANK